MSSQLVVVADPLIDIKIEERMISAIFDFDGVLVDSRPTIGDCLIDALGDFGISAPSPLETSLLVGPPLELGLIEFLTRRGISLEELPEIIIRFRDGYAVKSVQNTYLFPGIREMLDSLYSENIALYIATSKPRFLTIPLIKELEIEEYFSLVQAPDDGVIEDKTETLRKLLCAISNSEVDSYRRFLMIGDREADIRAARKNNLKSIGVSWGYGTQDELLTVKPNYLVQTPNLLLQILISEKNQMEKN